MKQKIIEILVFLYPRLNQKIRRFIRLFILKIDGGEMYSSNIRSIYLNNHKIDIGYGSYGGCFSLINIPSNVEFGNYCSIAPNVKIFRANHPVSNFTTHPILYNPVGGYVKKDMLLRPRLIIGHDVWIGEGAITLANVKNIGNGAVIGAGAVVTKDVEHYTIVVGNPSRVIKRRFTNDVIEKLNKTEWWKSNKLELIKK